MKTSSINARVRCKHCRAKVTLSPARVKELSAKLALTLDCPACGKVFTTALLRESEAEPVAIPAPVPAAVPPPVPVKPPFRPLLQADAAPAPPLSPKQPHFAPLDDPYAAKAPPLAAGPTSGWWNGLSPGTRKLVLAGIVAVMALGLGVYKFRPKAPPAAAEQVVSESPPEPETSPE